MIILGNRSHQNRESKESHNVQSSIADMLAIDQIKPCQVNTIIELNQDKKDRHTYYFPAYIRLKLKNILSVSISELNAEILLTLNITISVKGFEEYITTKFNSNYYTYLYQELTSKLMIQFSRDQAMILNKDSEDLNIRFKSNEQEQSFTFTIWKTAHLNVIPKRFWLSPFELVDLILTVTLNPIKCDYSGCHFIFRFNCMNTDNNFVKISYVPEIIQYGQYKLARGLTAMITSNLKYHKNISQANNNKSCVSRIANKFKDALKKSQNQKKNRRVKTDYLNQSNRKLQDNQLEDRSIKISQPSFKAHQYCHFILPMYRTPIVDLLTIFIPLWLLGLLNIFVFFQESVFADRLANIGGIMIAFSALVPTIRSQIPPAPQITLIQILIYLEVSTCLLAMVHSYLIRDQDPSQVTQDFMGNALFWTAVSINIATFGINMILFLIFFCYWRPKYNYIEHDQNEGQFQLDCKQNWYNNTCQQQFIQYRNKIEKKPNKLISIVCIKQQMFEGYYLDN